MDYWQKSLYDLLHVSCYFSHQISVILKALGDLIL